MVMSRDMYECEFRKIRISIFCMGLIGYNLPSHKPAHQIFLQFQRLAQAQPTQLIYPPVLVLVGA